MKLKTLTSKQIKDMPIANALTLYSIEANTVIEPTGKPIKDDRGVDWYKLKDGYISVMFCEELDEKSDNTQDKKEETSEISEEEKVSE